MTMHMYLGQIPFSFKNLKKVILKRSLGYDLNWPRYQIVRSPCCYIIVTQLHNTFIVFVYGDKVEKGQLEAMGLPVSNLF